MRGSDVLWLVVLLAAVAVIHTVVPLICQQFNIDCRQQTLSTNPLNSCPTYPHTPSQCTLSTHLNNPPYQPTLSTPTTSTTYYRIIISNRNSVSQ